MLVKTLAGSRKVTVAQAIIMKVARRALSDHAPSQRLFLKMHKESVYEHCEVHKDEFKGLEQVEKLYSLITESPKEIRNKNISHINKKRRITRKP